MKPTPHKKPYTPRMDGADMVQKQHELDEKYLQIQQLEAKLKVEKEVLIALAAEYEKENIYSHHFTVVYSDRIDSSAAKPLLEEKGFTREDYSKQYWKADSKKIKQLLGKDTPLKTSRYLKKKTWRKDA